MDDTGASLFVGLLGDAAGLFSEGVSRVTVDWRSFEGVVPLALRWGGVTPLPFLPPRRPRPLEGMVLINSTIACSQATQTKPGPQGRYQIGNLYLQAFSQIVDFQSRPRTLTKLSNLPPAN
jgi:hypothetical protein